MRGVAVVVVVTLGLAVAAAGCSGAGGAAGAAPAVSTPTSAPEWLWPVTGDIVAPFGPAHPRGIDIAAAVGTDVRATRAGQVVSAGGNSCCDTGIHVIVDHGDGFVSVYGRLAAAGVRVGQYVAAGGVIGTSGDSGDEGAAAPHLHFEIRRGDVYQNPTPFLAGALAATPPGGPAR